ncbi:hypothetical protein CK498_03065 [Halomonas salipaludis]|uniref:Uncharacterized protein n=2 Tax=Halomonas salipaludis TaxID=2032625 RepID=A0A2A2F3X1_9GAMM|nr:hypothetical protein CK498_03065 [Halomonas salipaludis]
MSSMTFKDQAAGLRQWAGELDQTTAADVDTPSVVTPRRDAAVSCSGDRALLVVGLPDGDTARVYRLLDAWRHQGQAWVGDPQGWRVVALDENSPHLATLAAQQTRWALWVDSDPDAFRRSYCLLRRLAERGGPHGLLLLHPRLGVSRGLLNNLRQAAADFLGIRLLMVRQAGQRS